LYLVYSKFLFVANLTSVSDRQVSEIESFIASLDDSAKLRRCHAQNLRKYAFRNVRPKNMHCHAVTAIPKRKQQHILRNMLDTQSHLNHHSLNSVFCKEAAMIWNNRLLGSLRCCSYPIFKKSSKDELLTVVVY
jgi:HrpA-like RNA helicase